MIVESSVSAKLSKLIPLISTAIVSSLKELLEKKHLYQKATVNWPNLEDALQIGLLEKRDREDSREWENIHSISQVVEWSLEGQTGETKAGYQTPNFKEIHVAIKIKPPTIKIFCRVCDEIMPYNFIGGSDISDDFRNYKNQVSSQIFIMKYQCQGCNSTPEVFMIQRDGPKIILTGRTPMEKVITPNYIPKSVKKYYSDAIVAFNSGQTLAGNFLLRTFVEQYIRSKSENSDSQDVDKLLIDYKRILPDDFKQRFPSLESIYATLSNDIHTAGASEKVFNQAIEDINLHFDAKRIYKIHSS